MGLVQELAQGPRPTHFPLHSHPTNPYNLATKQRSRSQAAATSSTATSGRGAGLGDVGDREAGKKERNQSQNSTPNQTELTPDQVEFLLCFFVCFFCGMTCGPGRKKAQKKHKKSTKNHGIWTICLKIWGGEPGAMGGEPEARGWSREPEPIWTWLSSCSQCNHNLPSFLSFIFPLAVRARNPGHLLPFQS